MHADVLPHDVAEFLVNIVYRLLAAYREQFGDLLLDFLLSLVEGLGVGQAWFGPPAAAEESPLPQGLRFRWTGSKA